MEKILTPFKLIRKDGRAIDVTFYDNPGITEVEILDIKKLKFEGKKTKDIRKTDIKQVVFKDKSKVYLQNNRSKIVAALSKTHIDKFISTIFKRDVESRYSYLKKEIISNIDIIFYSAIPILKHDELKNKALYHNQIIHRLVLPLKIGGIIFLVMITVKERTDYKEMSIDEFAIYDLYSEAQEKQSSIDSPSEVSTKNNFVPTNSHYQINNKKSLGSSSMVSSRTFLSHYRMITYSINDLIEFVKSSMTKIQ